jgi:hypothetical protein
VRNKIYVAVDSIEAASSLKREGKPAAVPRPDRILLDLILPRKGAFG